MMRVLKTPEFTNISAFKAKGRLIIRRTKTDKIGRRYSYGDYYDAVHEIGKKYERFSSSEVKWMKDNIGKSAFDWENGLPCGAKIRWL